jgi:hypothetical protein
MHEPASHPCSRGCRAKSDDQALEFDTPAPLDRKDSNDAVALKYPEQDDLVIAVLTRLPDLDTGLVYPMWIN